MDLRTHAAKKSHIDVNRKSVVVRPYVKILFTNEIGLVICYVIVEDILKDNLNPKKLCVEKIF